MDQNSEVLNSSLEKQAQAVTAWPAAQESLWGEMLATATAA